MPGNQFNITIDSSEIIRKLRNKGRNINIYGMNRILVDETIGFVMDEVHSQVNK